MQKAIFTLFILVPENSKMRSTSEENVGSQIKVPAFIQGVRLSHSFNKSRTNLKSLQFVR